MCMARCEDLPKRRCIADVDGPQSASSADRRRISSSTSRSHRCSAAGGDRSLSAAPCSGIAAAAELADVDQNAMLEHRDRHRARGPRTSRLPPRAWRSRSPSRPEALEHRDRRRGRTRRCRPDTAATWPPSRAPAWSTLATRTPPSARASNSLLPDRAATAATALVRRASGVVAAGGAAATGAPRRSRRRRSGSCRWTKARSPIGRAARCAPQQWGHCALRMAPNAAAGNSRRAGRFVLDSHRA